MIKIPLRGGHTALIDEEFLPLVSEYKWYLYSGRSGHNYAQGYHPKTKKRIHMHRLIMGVTKRNDWIDHKNHNGLDNRISNLRICTPSQNQSHRKSAKNSSSIFLGVCFHKKGNLWVSNICKDGRTEYLGCFSDEREAALAYNNRAKELHGEFAKLNDL